MRRRPEGSITFDSTRNRWISRAYVVDAAGVKHRLARSANTEREARALLREMLDADATLSSTVQLSALMAVWLESRRAGLRPKTYNSYEQQIRLHIVPALGALPLNELAPRHIERLCASLLKRDLGRTAQMVRGTLRTALRFAMRERLVTMNAAELSNPPKVRKRTHRLPDLGEVYGIIGCVPDPVKRTLFLFLVHTGLRPEREALPLTWDDIVTDDDGATWVNILESKTAAGEGLRPIPAFVKDALDAIRGESRYVFPNEVGGRLDYHNVRRAWNAAQARFWAQREDEWSQVHPGETFEQPQAVTMYSLRHLFGTSAADAGIHEHVLAGLMGHASASTTQQYYVHARQAKLRDASHLLVEATKDALKDAGNSTNRKTRD